MIFRNIGTYGPIVLFILALNQLYSRTKYLFWFCVLVAINELLIRWLKEVFHEPRPIKLLENIDLLGEYGMPSGHAQHSLFIVVFASMVHPSWTMGCIYAGITLIVLAERYYDKYHTIRQILVGCVCGALLAYVSVILLHKLFEKGDHS